jgi:Ca2+-binding RTX toxin-like protein
MLNRTVATAVALMLSGGALAVVQAAPAHAVLTCGGEPVSIVGTSGDDILTGTYEKDVILAGGGNDRIDGLGGNDVICGEDGRDTIHGGDGEDTVWGDRGSDYLFGDDGNDTLWGGTDGCSAPVCNSGDVDRIDGGAGDDKLFAAHYGRGVLRGEDGEDRLHGGTLDDKLLGGAGRDYRTGDEGNDTLAGHNAFGTPGTPEFFSDWLDGNGGSDKLYVVDGDTADMVFGESQTTLPLPGTDTCWVDVIDPNKDNAYQCEVINEVTP